jgi:hypothetical protein
LAQGLRGSDTGRSSFVLQIRPASLVGIDKDSAVKMGKKYLSYLTDIKQQHDQGDMGSLATSLKSMLAETNVDKAMFEQGTPPQLLLDSSLPLSIDDEVVDGSQIKQIVSLPEYSQALAYATQVFDSVEDPSFVLDASEAGFKESKEEDVFSEFGANVNDEYGQGSWFDSASSGLPGIGKMLRRMKRNGASFFHKRSKVPGGAHIERHHRRLQENQQCGKRCEDNDFSLSCECERLIDCGSQMSTIDLATMFVDGYVDRENGNFTTTDFTLFHDEDHVPRKINRIMVLLRGADHTDPSKVSLSKCYTLQADVNAKSF